MTDNDIPYFSDNQSPSFKENGDAILQVLSSEEIDFDELLSLVMTRERMVTDHLEGLSGEAKSTFAKEELKTNDDLKAIIGKLKDDQQALLVNFLRNRKAIKKYGR